MPPLPSPKYLPFQAETGIHTSMLMFESEVGVNVAAIRQNVGMPVNVWPVGAVNDPAGTDWAAVIVVSCSSKPKRLAHVAAAAGVAPTATGEASSAAESTFAAPCRAPDMQLKGTPPVLQFIRGGHSSGIPASRRPIR
jgi:hypothetical protein